MSVRNRNKEIRKVRVGDLWDNPANHRVHPDGQKAAMAGILKEVGYVGTVLAFEMEGGELRILDGHMRKESLDPDQEVDVCIVDLEPDERRKILATHDAIGAMAEIDHQALDVLIQQANIEDPALKAMLADLSESAALSESEEDEGPFEADQPAPFEEPPMRYQVIATCENESQQAQVMEMLEREGLKCRKLTA